MLASRSLPPTLPSLPPPLVQALTTANASLQADTMRRLLKMQCGNGLMHESVNVHMQSADSAAGCSRPVFEWSNAMLVALVEETLGLDCDAEAQRLHLAAVRKREASAEANPVGYGLEGQVRMPSSPPLLCRPAAPLPPSHHVSILPAGDAPAQLIPGGRPRRRQQGRLPAVLRAPGAAL